MSFVTSRTIKTTTAPILLRQTRCIASPATTAQPVPTPTPVSRTENPLTEPETEPSTRAGSSRPNHFKITLHRSAIGLPKRYRETLESLGIRRRGQTVFHAHSGASAGKILRLKELVKVENVTQDQVKSPSELRKARKAVRGYVIKERFKGGGSGSSTTWMDEL